MNFGDVSARLKKKQEETNPSASGERDHEEVHALRARILGVLMRDARLSHGSTEAEVAEALNVTEDQVRDWEFGREAPSLPQLEMGAYYLGVPVSHFWNTKTITAEQDEPLVPEAQYTELPDRGIGTNLTLPPPQSKLCQAY